MVAELMAPRTFRVREQAAEEPGPGEVQVRIDAVGVCGSDLHSYSEGAVGDTPAVYPMVLGHEPAGTVLKTGPGVTGWSAGDHAALEPAIYCYHCEYCRSGRYNICANIRFLSQPNIPGFFRGVVNLPVENLFALPKSVSLDVATLVEPLAVTLHSMKFARIQPGDTAVVFGGGAIGLLTIACLKLVGTHRVWAVEPVAHRRDLARHMGADATIDPGQVDAAEAILSETGGRGVDCAIDCAAKEHTTNQAIRAARNGGRLVLTGIHSAVMVPFEVSPMRRKELEIYNVRRSNEECPAARDLVVEREKWFAPLITHTRPIEEISDAFRIADAYTDGVGRMVIRAA